MYNESYKSIVKWMHIQILGTDSAQAGPITAEGPFGEYGKSCALINVGFTTDRRPQRLDGQRGLFCTQSLNQ